MTIQDFEKLNHFKYDEVDYKGRKIWHNKTVLENTDFETMLAINNIRNFVGKPFIPHCAYDPAGHLSGSMHYRSRGTAIDGHFFNTQYSEFLNDIELIQEALYKYDLVDVCGLGIYPNWQNAGIHFDLRGMYPNPPRGKNKARWGARYVRVKKVNDYGEEYYIYEQQYDSFENIVAEAERVFK